MEFRRQHTQLIAAAKAGISERTARRIERDPRLPSQRPAGLKRRRQVPDPLERSFLLPSTTNPLESLATLPEIRLNVAM